MRTYGIGNYPRERGLTERGSLDAELAGSDRSIATSSHCLLPSLHCSPIFVFLIYLLVS